ncbi:MAG TPA: flagellar biosynthesis protein FlhB [Steroidobacteraceae bacterium]|nr:flagellar biosynthesis protein FlhB [Steroidobacteraceae bacterium]
MAENEQQERTEQPTSKRLEEARKEGQVPRSSELSAAAVLLTAGGGLHFLGGYMGSRLHGLMTSGLSLSREQALDESLMTSTLSTEVAHALLACAPVMGLTLVAALTAPMLLGGWNLSFQALTPDFTRLNPLNGFSRMFSTRGAVELGKAFAKFLALALVAFWLLRQKSGELMGLGSEPISMALVHAASLTGYAFLMLAGTLGLIAAVDVPWQLWQHTQRLRMTRQEIREEMKESEGSPEIKGRIRTLQRELARRRMMQEVPKADVVVVNPTHFAVALRYDETRMRAPIVVAKGADLVAARIREVATEHLVPIFEAPPLARALFRSVEIGNEIPATLYVAVAQVLTYIYQLKSARRDGMTPPNPPDIDPTIDTTKH